MLPGAARSVEVRRQGGEVVRLTGDAEAVTEILSERREARRPAEPGGARRSGPAKS